MSLVSRKKFTKLLEHVGAPAFLAAAARKKQQAEMEAAAALQAAAAAAAEQKRQEEERVAKAGVAAAAATGTPCRESDRSILATYSLSFAYFSCTVTRLVSAMACFRSIGQRIAGQ